MNAAARSYASVDARQWGFEASGSLAVRTPLSISGDLAYVRDTYFVEHLSYQRDPYRSGVRVAEPGRNLLTNVSWTF